jgi:tetratricopeptide (TPR) repeat protein
MKPLELVAKTLHSFNEKELTYQLLDAFGKKAQTVQQYDDVAKIFFEVKNFPKAIEYGEKALQQAKTKQERYILSKNLINAYNQSNYPEKALTQIDFCKKINPQDAELLLEETFTYSALGQKDKSEKLLFNLLQKKSPEEIERKAYHNLSGYYFRKNDLHTALEHFLRAGEVEAYKNQKLPEYEKWDGTVTPGRTIIIDNQCGAGDEVIHIRFMKHLKELGMKPIWNSTRRELVELFNYNGYDAVCCWDKPQFPKDSCWVYGLALPYHLDLKVEDLGKDPYLKSIPEIDKKWEWMHEDKMFKIGLFWASSSGYEQNQFRSVGLDEYMSILRDTNVSLYSLQTHTDNKDADRYSEIKQTLSIPDREYADTFSIINNLDLIITSCSFTAHVAASLGKEVCVFVPIMEYYVWIHESGKSAWYGDNVHIFKQVKPRDWKDPINKLSEFLMNRELT